MCNTMSGIKISESSMVDGKLTREEFREKRKHFGITIDMLAEHCKIGASTIWNFESGNKDSYESTYIQMKQGLDDLAELYSDENVDKYMTKIEEYLKENDISKISFIKMCGVTTGLFTLHNKGKRIPITTIRRIEEASGFIFKDVVTKKPEDPAVHMKKVIDQAVEEGYKAFSCGNHDDQKEYRFTYRGKVSREKYKLTDDMIHAIDILKQVMIENNWEGAGYICDVYVEDEFKVIGYEKVLAGDGDVAMYYKVMKQRNGQKVSVQITKDEFLKGVS